MALKEVYESAEEVPAVHRELYTERSGKFVFTGLEGYTDSKSVKGLKDEAGGYRIKLRDATSALDTYRGLKGPDGTAFEKPEALQAILDELPTLRAAAEAGGGKSAEAVTKQVDAARKVVEQQFGGKLTEAQKAVEKSNARVQRLENAQRAAFIRDSVTKSINESKIGKFNPDAVEDAHLYAERHLTIDEERDEEGNLIFKAVITKDGVGVTPGLDPAAWLGEMQQRKGHWYMPSEGGGSKGPGGGGGGGSNPWSKEGWNMTHQSAYVRQFGMAKAENMAKAAGTYVGASVPGQKQRG